MFKGADISKHNGKIDFSIIKNQLDFIILRAAYRGITYRKIYTDEKFFDNIEQINEMNIPVGLYIYSTAVNESEGIKEAEYCLSLAKNYRITYPIIIDIEDETNQGCLSKQELTNIIKAFCETIENNNYYAMFYCSKYWYTTKLDSQALKKYDRWIAQWEAKECEIDCGIWQYTSKGKIVGISGSVDLNYSYKNYPLIIKNNELNKIKNRTYEVGDKVSFDRCYISSDSDISLSSLYHSGIITKIIPGAKNPYLIGDGICWVRESDIKNI
ncbi:glycoside hydrolase family 25 protein [Massilimicrobiota timonensis]|uniref:glycoside hydrolase family 25 protein n=1 Tax=Massilimicrobiota timonensis TaxID=1776392 RepID=UPI0013EA93C0|nr:glycoside hydrolase family 25 protein [Massilimicrobiota timonensis]